MVEDPAGMFEEESDDGLVTPLLLHARRQWEEANLGMAFTSAAGMDRLREALEQSGMLRERILTTAGVEQAAVGQSVYLIGLLCQIRTVDGPSEGDKVSGKMAVGRIEDAEGGMELVAFPPNYKRHEPLWVEGNLVVVTGRVSRHADGEVYLLCEHMAPFYLGEEEEELSVKVKTSRKAARADAAGDVVAEAEAVAASADAKAAEPIPLPRTAPPTNPPATPSTPASVGGPSYTLIVTLPNAHDDRRFIDAMSDLNSLLRRHPGNDVVRLRIPYSLEPGAVTSAVLPWGVRMSAQLEMEIRELLGPEALAVIQMAA
jgi:hypothetical protein